MRPDVIQDEHMNHEDQIVHERYLSDTCGGQYKGSCQARCKDVTRNYSQIRSAAATRQTRSGSLSSKRRRQLDCVVLYVNENIASMTEALLRAANSQCIDPALLKKLMAVKADLETVAVNIKMYREKNEEHGTAQLKLRVTRRVSAARKWFTYVDKILSMATAEL